MKAALALTLGRILLCPVFLMIYLFYAEMGISLVVMPYILLVILILSELSDVFDGVIARRRNEVTELGKVLDPMADSIVRISILLAFTQGIVKLSLPLVLIFLARDAMISTLRTLCAMNGKVLAARFSGKLKAVLQAICIFAIVLLMIPYSLDLLSLYMLRKSCFWIVFLTACYTLLSGVEYLWTHRRYIKKAWR